MSLGGVPRSAAESAGFTYGGNSGTGADGGNGGAGRGVVRAGSIDDGLGSPGLGLFPDSFGFPMEGFSFDGVLDTVATGSNLTPENGGNSGVLGGTSGRQLQQNHIHNQQQIQQPSQSSNTGSQLQSQISPRQPQQQQQISRHQQLQQQAREQVASHAAAQQQSANINAQLAAAAAGQLPQSTLARTKQLNKVAGQNGGVIVGGTVPNPGPTSSPVGPSALSVNSNQLRRPTAPSIPGRVPGGVGVQQSQQQHQHQQNMMNLQAGAVGNGGPQLPLDDVAVRGPYFPDIPRILPHERVFPIQIGSELFKLSGASISSDAPSYFSNFFEQQLANDPDAQVRTLYIDRDPVTFRDIARHLQGYYVSPEDAGHYVRLFADAQFYTLPKLISQLYESDFYIYIGGTHFRIPRDTFSSPGDSSNFFGLNVSVNFTKSGDLFPGLPREGLLRPPSIAPPNVPNHSPETFKELLHALRGYPIHIRNEEHRQELLQDCRYYNLRCLEQKLIPHSISYNLRRDCHEIVIRIEDIKPSRIAYRPENPSPHQIPSPDAPMGFVVYGRPWVDGEDYELIVEIGGETTKLDRRDMRVEFVGQTNRRVTNFLQRIADKLNLATTQPLGLQMMAQAQQAAAAAAGATGTGAAGAAAGSSRGAGAVVQGGLPPSPGNTPLSEDRVKVRIDRDAHIILDGEEVEWVSWGTYNPNEDDGSIPGEDVLTPGNAYQLNIPSIPPPPRPSSSGSPNVVMWPPPPQQTSPLQNRAHPPPPPRPLKRRRLSTDSGTFPPRAGGSVVGSNPGGTGGQRREWIIKRGQWRVRIQRKSNSDGKGGMEVVLCAVKIEAFSGELGRNMGRVFLA